MTFYKVWVFCLTLTCLLGVANAATEWGTVNDISALLEKKYGLIAPDSDPKVARVHHIFDRVQDVADKRGNRMPQLGVVNTSDAPWAIALPDGTILLSLGAVTLCYNNVPQSEGDARIAFVIGHELAHLAKNDFWNMDLYLAIAGAAQAASAGKPLVDDPATAADPRQRQLMAWNKETEADDLGFSYAGISGYPVQSLFNHGDDPKKNFFYLWTEQSKGDSPRHALHPPPKEREAFLRARLEQLGDEISFFKFGLRLAHFGHCEQGVSFLRKFLRLFPAREVYNNVGACHLQRAEREMRGTGVTASYWLPLLFDVATQAEALLLPYRGDRSRGNSVPTPPVVPDKAGHELEQAVEYLEQAAAADANYLPARLNLATAYYYQGEILKARGALDEALNIAPNNKEVMGWHALFLYWDSQENGFGAAALPHLTKRASLPNAPLSLLFNHALLLKKLGKKVRKSWTHLAARSTLLPAYYARIACVEAKAACAKPRPIREHPLPWSLPVEPGVDLDTLNRESLFSGWQANRLGWLPDKQQGTVYRQGEVAEVLDLDGYVVMVVLRGRQFGTAKALQKKLGNPIEIQPMASGEIWRYGSNWAVLVRTGEVREVWVSQKE